MSGSNTTTTEEIEKMMQTKTMTKMAAMEVRTSDFLELENGMQCKRETRWS